MRTRKVFSSMSDERCSAIINLSVVICVAPFLNRSSRSTLLPLKCVSCYYLSHYIFVFCALPYCTSISVLADCTRYSTQSGEIVDMTPAKRQELEQLIVKMVRPH